MVAGDAWVSTTKYCKNTENTKTTKTIFCIGSIGLCCTESSFSTCGLAADRISGEKIEGYGGPSSKDPPTLLTILLTNLTNMSLPTIAELSHTVGLLTTQVSDLTVRLNAAMSSLATVSSSAATAPAAAPAAATAAPKKQRKSKKNAAATAESTESNSSASATTTETTATKAKKAPKPKPEFLAAEAGTIRFGSASGKSPYISFSPLYKADFTLDGKTYATVEHYVQSQKYATTDPEYSEQLRLTEKPATLRLLASTKKHPAPADWESQLHTVYTTGSIAKFAAHPTLREVLQSTGTAKLENESTDAILGIGVDGSGSNILGAALMVSRHHTY